MITYNDILIGCASVNSSKSTQTPHSMDLVGHDFLILESTSQVRLIGSIPVPPW